jgi:mRNA-degrading endonuclease RelE of RelBE toxin-antitoxin system
MTYVVYVTESFEKEIDKLSLSEREIIKKICLQLKENPFNKIRYGIVKEKKGLSRVVLTTEIKV